MTSSPQTISANQTLSKLINDLYGVDQSVEIMRRLQAILQAHKDAVPEPPSLAGPPTERDAVLITYADMLRQPDLPPLQSLHQFLREQVMGSISTVHLLPFFPYSSDDGFSVIDYRAVDPEIGTWADIESLGRDFRLMIDAVINHISSQSDWFQRFLQGQASYKEYFIDVDPHSDLSKVVRPRDLPLLTPVETNSGTRHVWTTFSPDQIDLNYGNPEVLLEIIDLLLFYIREGAQIIRLDAIAFLWKEPGTTSINLPETHHIIQLLRTILDEVSPWVALLTETNVPHDENISYFGDGANEAHLVYQFALPPLTLHTFAAGSSQRLTTWAANLTTPSDQVTFFNFLASHDGIGLRPVREILSQAEIDHLVALTPARGGDVSYRRIKKDERQPYELNINYLNALSPPGELDKDPERSIQRFLAAQAIMLSLAGVPGIYFHSLFGSQNDLEAVRESGQPRSINRGKFERVDFEATLADDQSIAAQILAGYKKLLAARRTSLAFNPFSGQKALSIDEHLFALQRGSPDEGLVLCLHEIGGENRLIDLSPHSKSSQKGKDLLSGEVLDLGACSFSPYQVRWIELDP